jgi:hypothetical protein
LLEFIENMCMGYEEWMVDGRKTFNRQSIRYLYSSTLPSLKRQFTIFASC